MVQMDKIKTVNFVSVPNDKLHQERYSPWPPYRILFTFSVGILNVVNITILYYFIIPTIDMLSHINLAIVLLIIYLAMVKWYHSLFCSIYFHIGV